MEESGVFFSDKPPQLDFPQSPSPSHDYPRAAVICGLIQRQSLPFLTLPVAEAFRAACERGVAGQPFSCQGKLQNMAGRECTVNRRQEKFPLDLFILFDFFFCYESALILSADVLIHSAMCCCSGLALGCSFIIRRF